MSLKERQPKVLDFLHKQSVQNKISHAYLLVGDTDTKEVGYHIAQSLFCKEGGCGICITCQRIKNHEHGDFVFVSGKNKLIKKEDIMEIKSRFLQTSLEDVDYKVYMIEDVDNASVVAMNAFLKFLEDPESDIVAILTTSNLNRVLETIKSRCVILHLEPTQSIVLEEKLLESGLDSRNAKVISKMASNMEEALKIDGNPMFHTVMDTFNELQMYYKDKRYIEAGIHLQVSGIKTAKFDLEAISWLCDLHLIEYAKTNLNLVKVALNIKDRIRPGVVSSMLIDQFVYVLNETMKAGIS